MNHPRIVILVAVVCIFHCFTGSLLAQNPTVTITTPHQNELDVKSSTLIKVQFDRNMNDDTFDNSTFVVSGRFSGRHYGVTTYTIALFEMQFTPYIPFAAGENVTVTITGEVESSDGFPLDQPYIWSFNVETGTATGALDLDSTYPCNAYPLAIVACDLDNDLDLDLFTANFGSDDVLRYYNDGNGVFTPASSLPAGRAPQCAVACDVNGDGYADIVASNQGENADTAWTMSVILNDGAGGFLPHRQDSVSVPTSSIATGDFTGDGYPDLVLINKNTDDISVLLNNGDGHFSTETFYATGISPSSATVADLENDGDLDIAVACYGPNSVQTFINDGSGAFTFDGEYGAHNRPWSIQSTDVDADGFPDLAVACWGDTVSLLVNDGSGNFGTAVGIPACDMPRSVFASDIDGDGDQDLATVCQYDDQLFLMANSGSGSFSGSAVSSGGASPQALVLADLNGDKVIDAAIANWNTYDITVHLSSPSPECGDADASGSIDIDDVIFIVNYVFTGGPAPDPINIGDVNCLDDMDIDDVIYLVAYVFLGGPLPCDPNGDEVPDC